MQYRMHSGLLEFPNKKYYDNIIQTGINDNKRTLIPVHLLDNGI